MSEPLYLLDSNICIYVLEGGPPAVRRRVEGFALGEVVTSSIAYAEVMRGLVADPLKIKAAAAFFRIISPLPFGQEEARLYANLPFLRAGFDRLIAAHAIARNLIFVTNNERDFRDIAKLRVENWTR